MKCKECGFSGSTLAGKCTNCGHVDTSIRLKGYLSLIVAILFVFGGAYLFLQSTDDQASSDNMNAWFACKTYVNEKLKTPSTADFARYTDARFKVLENNSISVSAYVDADNSFGANTRTRFICTVTRSRSSGQWVLKSLSID